MSYDYESDWKEYVFPDSESEFASAHTIKEMFSEIKLDSKEATPGGIPIICDGKTAYINTETEHTLIFGETGSGKSWSLIFPLIPLLGSGKTSMVVTDIKGELSYNRNVRGYLKHQGYECVFIDVRKFDKDCYNIMEYPFSLYRRGEKDKAMACVTAFVNSLSARYENSRADPFWQLSAEEFMIPLIQMLFDICSRRRDYYKYVNMLSVASYCNEAGAEYLSDVLSDYVTAQNNATEMLRSVLSNPEKTRACILTTVTSFIRDFLIQDSLLRMLSHSTFDIRDMYKKKMCIFLILPDETAAYNSTIALLIDYFYNQLIDEYTDKYQNTRPSYDIAWVLDEFCNLHINGMETKISASRGRLMRWYLVCQSKKQLEAVFEKSASTIIGNCKNIFFLQSSCPDTLSYISEMLGTTNITHSGKSEPLMSPEKLKSLPKTKEFRQAIYIRDNLKFKVNMLGFDKYKHLDKYADSNVSIPSKKAPAPPAYTPSMMMFDLKNKIIVPPFSA